MNIRVQLWPVLGRNRLVPEPSKIVNVDSGKRYIRGGSCCFPWALTLGCRDVCVVDRLFSTSKVVVVDVGQVGGLAA